MIFLWLAETQLYLELHSWQWVPSCFLVSLFVFDDTCGINVLIRKHWLYVTPGNWSKDSVHHNIFLDLLIYDHFTVCRGVRSPAKCTQALICCIGLVGCTSVESCGRVEAVRRMTGHKIWFKHLNFLLYRFSKVPQIPLIAVMIPHYTLCSVLR